LNLYNNQLRFDYKDKMNSREEIIERIALQFPNEYLKSNTIPKPFFGHNKTRVVILGADPSNFSSKSELKKVFKLELEEKSPYFKSILNNLKLLDINLDDLFVQNVIQNYMNAETSNNQNWDKIALIWIPHLKHELDKFDRSVPIIVTAWKILEILVGHERLKGIKAKDIYKDHIFFDRSENSLGRNLYCLFRHYTYNLNKWPSYKKFLFNEIML
jgi:hypothetical protein